MWHWTILAMTLGLKLSLRYFLLVKFENDMFQCCEIVLLDVSKVRRSGTHHRRSIHHPDPGVTRCSRLLRGQFCPKIKSVAIDIKLSPSDRVSAAVVAAAAVLPLPRLNELAKIDNTASIRLLTKTGHICVPV